ncbi:hypothetical protein [Streptomyces sp. A30]|uniref:hypothetical protein n=1 Tax=Streptomyces sp. A30 TaxID=2789273 RepID=UPI0039809552
METTVRSVRGHAVREGVGDEDPAEAVRLEAQGACRLVDQAGGEQGFVEALWMLVGATGERRPADSDWAATAGVGSRAFPGRRTM